MTDTPEAVEIHRLIDSLDRDTRSLGKDHASGSVRAGVSSLKTAVDDGATTVAETLRALEVTVSRLHMSHMQPLLTQTLRSLRTALHLDHQWT